MKSSTFIWLTGEYLDSYKRGVYCIKYSIKILRLHSPSREQISWRHERQRVKLKLPGSRLTFLSLNVQKWTWKLHYVHQLPRGDRWEALGWALIGNLVGGVEEGRWEGGGVRAYRRAAHTHRHTEEGITCLAAQYPSGTSVNVDNDSAFLLLPPPPTYSRGGNHPSPFPPPPPPASPSIYSPLPRPTGRQLVGRA